MNGTIYFEDTEALVSFLNAFTGNTAMFDVTPCDGRYSWMLSFTGGH